MKISTPGAKIRGNYKEATILCKAYQDVYEPDYADEISAVIGNTI